MVTFNMESDVTAVSSGAIICRLQVLVRELISSKHFIEILVSVDELTGK